MKKLLGIAVFSSAIIIGYLGTESDDKSEVSNLPDGFSASCYWENQQSVQGECGENDESCIESHYLEVGERADFEYECSDVVSSSMDSTSSEVVSSSSEAVISSEVVISSSEVVCSSSSVSTPGTFTDCRDNATYKYVTIGTQVWMAENLNYGVSGSYCYDNDLSNCDIYGRLYEWNTAMSGASSSNATPSGVQGVCPSGWHLPSDAEWTILNDYVDANNGIDAVGNSLKANSVGNSLKATTGWDYSRVSKATDQFGFSALPAGTSESNGMAFVYEGACGHWWSATTQCVLEGCLQSSLGRLRP